MAKQVKPLKEMLDLRTRLQYLRRSRCKATTNSTKLLLDAVGNTEKLEKLKGEIGAKGEAPMAEAPENSR